MQSGDAAAAARIGAIASRHERRQGGQEGGGALQGGGGAEPALRETLGHGGRGKFVAGAAEFHPILLDAAVHDIPFARRGDGVAGERVSSSPFTVAGSR